MVDKRSFKLCVEEADMKVRLSMGMLPGNFRIYMQYDEEVLVEIQNGTLPPIVTLPGASDPIFVSHLYHHTTHPAWSTLPPPALESPAITYSRCVASEGQRTTPPLIASGSVRHTKVGSQMATRVFKGFWPETASACELVDLVEALIYWGATHAISALPALVSKTPWPEPALSVCSVLAHHDHELYEDVVDTIIRNAWLNLTRKRSRDDDDTIPLAMSEHIKIAIKCCREEPAMASYWRRRARSGEFMCENVFFYHLPDLAALYTAVAVRVKASHAPAQGEFHNLAQAALTWAVPCRMARGCYDCIRHIMGSVDDDRGDGDGLEHLRLTLSGADLFQLRDGHTPTSLSLLALQTRHVTPSGVGSVYRHTDSQDVQIQRFALWGVVRPSCATIADTNGWEPVVAVSQVYDVKLTVSVQDDTIEFALQWSHDVDFGVRICLATGQDRSPEARYLAIKRYADIWVDRNDWVDQDAASTLRRAEKHHSLLVLTDFVEVGECKYVVSVGRSEIAPCACSEEGALQGSFVVGILYPRVMIW